MADRRNREEPTPDMSRSLGNLLVAAAHLRNALGIVTADPGRAHIHTDEWVAFTHHLLETHDSIVAAVATMRFTGSSSEHPVIRSADDVIVPADAGYITVISRRMERHAHIGTMLGGAVEDEPQRVSA